MKKMITAAIAMVFLVGLIPGVFAMEGGSLLNQNSFGLYDETDPYDLSLNPALLYNIDRWRLYTNLSNFEDESDAYYFLGTSGKVGPGSLALFYETTKNEDEYTEKWDWNEDEESREVPTTDGYTGDPSDWSYSETETEKDINNDEAQNFYLSYSMDMGMLSLGASYEPRFVEEEETLRFVDFVDGPGGVTYGNFGAAQPVAIDALEQDIDKNWPAVNRSESSDEILYTTLNHDEYWTAEEEEVFSGTLDTEDDTHDFTVASHVRASDRLDVEVGLSMGMRDRDVSQSGAYRYTYKESETGDAGVTSGDDPAFGLVGAVQADGYLEERAVTSKWSGDYWDLAKLGGTSSRDTDLFGLQAEPSYQVNDIVTLAMGLGYEMEDGDVSGGQKQDVTMSRTRRANAAADTQEWTGQQTFNNTWDGDYEATAYSLNPELHLTYGVVDFSLGMGYAYDKSEADGKLKNEATFSASYEDGNDTDATPGTAGDTDDWTLSGAYTGYTNFDWEEETTTWSYPVATRFQVTDKLSFRAGATYIREITETKYKQSEMDMNDNTSTVTDGEGTVDRVVSIDSDNTSSADGYVDASGDLQTYDPTRSKEGYKDKDETVSDRTQYRLGLGYQATENLQFDLMFKNDWSAGGVDMEEVYASVVLAF